MATKTSELQDFIKSSTNTNYEIADMKILLDKL